jgi:hypothetical protein
LRLNPIKVDKLVCDVTDRFHDSRRRHFGNSGACYKMGNYHPIFMQIVTQTEKNMLKSKSTKIEVQAKFQDGRHRRMGKSRAFYKMGNCHPIFMKIGKRTKNAC